MEGSRPAQPAQPGTHTCSLAVMPGIEKMTEQETAHPSLQQLSQLTPVPATGGVDSASLDNITVSHEIEERPLAASVSAVIAEIDERGEGEDQSSTEDLPSVTVDAQDAPAAATGDIDTAEALSPPQPLSMVRQTRTTSVKCAKARKEPCNDLERIVMAMTLEA